MPSPSGYSRVPLAPGRGSVADVGPSIVEAGDIGPTWRRLLGVPGIRRLVLATFFGRVASSMLPLALMMKAGEGGGSLAYAGLLTGVFAGASAAGGPLQARLLRRFGARNVLLQMALFSTLALTALLTAMTRSSPRPVVISLGLLAGITRPYTASVMRVVWKQVLARPRELLTAEAFEATAFPVAFATGPVVLALATAVSTPTMAIVVATITGCAATVVFADSPILAAASPTSPLWSGRGAVGGWPLVGLVVVGLSMFCGSEAVPVVVSALGGGRMSSSELEMVVSLLPLGGVVGGLAAARVRPRKAVEFQLTAALMVLAASLVVLSQVHAILAIGTLLFIAGVARAPAIAFLFHLAGEHGAGRAVEAIAWVAMTSYVGGALCRPLAGILADGFGAHAAGFTVVVPLAGTVAIATMALASRRPTVTA